EATSALVRLFLRRPNAQLKTALCDVRVTGTGPFRAAAPPAHGRAVALERVREQVGGGGGSGGGSGSVGEIQFIAELDSARALARLRHGEADLLGHLPESYWPDQAEAPATRRAFEPVRTGGVRLAYLVWNLRRVPASELDVPLALSGVR